jgi:hypothetical protein
MTLKEAMVKSGHVLSEGEGFLISEFQLARDFLQSHGLSYIGDNFHLYEQEITQGLHKVLVSVRAEEQRIAAKIKIVKTPVEQAIADAEAEANRIKTEAESIKLEMQKAKEEAEKIKVDAENAANVVKQKVSAAEDLDPEEEVAKEEAEQAEESTESSAPVQPTSTKVSIQQKVISVNSDKSTEFSKE